MPPEKKLCKHCECFAKTKLFKELRVVFNNWCDHYQKPLGLCLSCEFQEPEPVQEVQEIIEYEFVYY